MEIRPATPADVPAVLPMVDRLAALHQQWDPARYDYNPGTGEMYRRWLTSRAGDPRSVFLVAEHHDGGPPTGVPLLAGFLIGTAESNIPIYRTPTYGFIHDLWVEADYRHEGIARQMTMLAVERFRDMGLTQVRCETAAANDAARKLFERCGFRAASVEMMIEM